MGLIHNDALECQECGHNEFRSEERFIFHKRVRERVFDSDKEKPLPHMNKIIMYKCAKCHHELNR